MMPLDFLKSVSFHQRLTAGRTHTISFGSTSQLSSFFAGIIHFLVWCFSMRHLRRAAFGVVMSLSLISTLLAEEQLLFRCGTNAIYVYLKAQGAEIQQGQIDAALGEQSRPLSVAEIVSCSDGLGVPSEIKRFARQDTDRIPFPAIAFIPPTKSHQLGHFVVLLASYDSHMTLIDGTTGKLQKWHHNTLWQLWREPGVAVVARRRYWSWCELSVPVLGIAAAGWMIFNRR